MEKGTSKKDILQLEKRVIDLELATTEAKETAKDFELIPEFKQRLEDVEDLVMVENAGIIELRGMLEKLAPPEIKLPENLDERLKTAEEKIQSLPDFSELETRIKSSIPTSFPEFENRIKNLEGGVSQLNEKLVTTDFSQMENRIKDSILTTLPDLMQLENRIKDSVSTILPDLQRTKDEINKKLEDIELKRQEIEKKFSGEVTGIRDDVNKKLESIGLEGQKIEKLSEEIDEKLKTSVRERVEREFERVRDDWLAYSEKVNAVEKFVKGFSREIDEIRPTLKKLDSFERILDLDKRTGEKLQEFTAITKNLQKLAEKNTLVYDEIDKRTQALGVIEKELPSIQKNLSNVLDELERIKLEFVEKKDVASLVSNFRLISDDYKSLVEDMSKRIVNLQTGLNRNLKEMEVRTNGIISPLNSRVGKLEGNLSVIENKGVSLEKRVDDTWKSIPSLIDSQLQNVNKKLEALEGGVKNEVDEIHKVLGNIDSRMVGFESKVKDIKIEDIEKILGNVGSRLSEFENKINVLEGKYRRIEGLGGRVAELKAPQTFFDEQIRDLINRMIFLESRLVAIESSMQRTSMALPVIME